MRTIICSDNLPVLQSLPNESIDLIYIDPPFNTGKKQTRTTIKTVEDEDNEDRTGFGGKKYRTTVIGNTGFEDQFDDYIEFLASRLAESHRILSPTGSLFFHIDYREVHYCKVLLDSIFGRASFMNEIIWAYDFGGRSKRRWPTKHDNILWYVKDPANYTFNYDSIDRIPYMAPGLVGEEKAKRGKTPTDVWWNTIVPTNSAEKTGYATQKPLGIVSRIVSVHSNPEDVLLDFFAGSGTFGEAAANQDRNFILVDNNPEAIQVMVDRLKKFCPKLINCELPQDASLGVRLKVDSELMKVLA